MKDKNIDKKQLFIGRAKEQDLFSQFSKKNEAAIMIVYGRRRVGKTQLIEHTLADRNLIKLEGLENQPEADQIQHVLYQLSRYTGEGYLSKLQLNSWVEVFDLIADKYPDGKWTLYLEELQWLANYDTKLISALKYVWDNRFRHNSELRLVLCGSSPSFMIKKVVQSKALYNRSQQEILLKPFTLLETQEFLPKLSKQEILLAYLTVGGIPEYLKYLRNGASVFISICENSFTENAMFSNEYEKIFISSLADNVHYKVIISYLSQVKFASRAQISKHLKISSGGNLTDILTDLELCGFIEKYKPYHAKSGRGLYRYCIKDAYLIFYNKFIDPVKDDIQRGKFTNNPTAAIHQQSFNIWMGYAFERFVRDQQFIIAKMLGFSGLPYKSGVFYNRSIEQQNSGFQIDLIYEHSQHVYTICEIKYYAGLVDCSVIDEFEKKLALFPNRKNKTIKKVLITTQGATQELINRVYFDHIITLDDFFDPKHQ